MRLRVNGRPHQLEVREGWTLLDLLREGLGLTGAKPGCRIGACGACTVLLSARPVHACRVPAVEAEGAEVETVEGLADGEQLHPLQEEMLRAGAVGCGYCTPGILMRAIHLLRSEPSPSPELIRQTLAPHLCRCTGYQPVVRALLAAAARLRGEPPEGTPHNGVGGSPFRLDGMQKVTGRTRFTADLPLPEGTLHGAVVRSPVAHGELEAVDDSEALAVPGVERVMTAGDLPGLRPYGKARDDQPPLCHQRLRHRGDPVALVLARSAAEAAEGARAVRVRVRELPPVLDAESALGAQAPAIHPEGNRVAGFRIRRGRLDEAFRRARHVVEHRMETPFLEHALLETEAALVVPEQDGSFTVHAPTQNVYFDQALLARILGIPARERDRIHVIQAPTGAAFGKREDLSAQIPALLGAAVTGRPVRVVYSRPESHLATTKRHPMRLRDRSAWSADGRLLGLEAEILAETGPYASWVPNILRKAAVHLGGPYRVPAASVEARGAYTNRAVAGAMRGYGATQALLAAELRMERAARALQVDPLELRLRCALAPGDETLTGQALPSCTGLEAVLREAAGAFDWQGPTRGRRLADGTLQGFGIAGSFYGIGYGAGLPDRGMAELELEPSGRVLLRTAAVDYGQGAVTVLAQIAAETLGVPLEALSVKAVDTRGTPDTGSSVASRQTRVTGAAVAAAARRLRRAMDLAAKGLPEDRRGDRAALATEMERRGLDRIHRGRYLLRSGRPDDETGQGDVYATYALAACAVEVRVDPTSGRTRVVRAVSTHDSGRIVNPALARAQVAGGMAMGIGMALLEEYRFDGGRPLDLNLDRYRILRAPEMPELEIRFLEDAPDPEGPYGAKGLGEPAMLAVAPAVLAALADATGHLPERTPMTPERVRESLRPRKPPSA